jgi:hypothetical protein
MTVIASYDHYGCGMVIGDILITGPANSSKRRPSTHLPTLGNVSSTSDAPESGAESMHNNGLLCHCLGWAP